MSENTSNPHPSDTERLNRLERALLAGAEVVTDDSCIFIQCEGDCGRNWIARGDADLRAAIDRIPEALKP